jgi:hypothetical protein
MDSYTTKKSIDQAPGSRFTLVKPLTQIFVTKFVPPMRFYGDRNDLSLVPAEPQRSRAKCTTDEYTLPPGHRTNGVSTLPPLPLILCKLIARAGFSM